MSKDIDSSSSLAGLQDNLEQMRAAPIRLSEHYARSEKFGALFSYGMDLVEEAASFLDQTGRVEATRLPQNAKTLYATESMRLTTRLMQIASWLLLQRAVADGEMSREQAASEKKNVRINQLKKQTKSKYWSELPETFVQLVEKSLRLQNRICRLDQELYGEKSQEDNQDNPVNAQHDLLQKAFDSRFSKHSV